MVTFLDIETSALNAELGRVIAIGSIKNETPRVKAAWESPEEKSLLEWMNSKLGDSTIVTWYGSEFDIPFLLTRMALLETDTSTLLEAPKLDLYKKCRDNFNLSSYSQNSVAKYFGIEETDGLSGSDIPRLFDLAREGNRDAKSSILKHCENDLLTLKKIHERINSYIQ